MLPVLMALCALGIVLLWMLMPGESNAEMRAPFWGVNFAHRGLHSADGTVPENSLAAFTAAMDEGYGIELDVRLTRDGEVVVFHDETLLRACGRAEKLEDCTFEQLQALRLFETDQRIPLLSEVVQLVDAAVPLLIELKGGARRKQLCQATWRVLRRYDGDICVQSFDPRIVRWFSRHVPGLLRGQLTAPPAALGGGIAAVLVGWGLTNAWGRPHFIASQKGKVPLLMRFARRFAMRMVWTVGPEDDADALEEANDAVIFEFYDPLLKYAGPLAEPEFDPAEQPPRL